VKRSSSLLAGFLAGASAGAMLRKWMHAAHSQPFIGVSKPPYGQPAEQASVKDNRTVAISPRNRLAVRVLSVLALPIALSAMYVGGHDVLLSAVLGQRLLGTVFLSCGLALLIAAVVGAVGSLKSGSSSLVLLFSAGALPGVITLVLQTLAFRINFILLVWTSMAAIPAAAAAVVWSSGNRSGGLRQVNAILSAGAVVTALTVGQTIYSTAYSPIKRGESLTVITKISPTTERKIKSPKLGSVRAFRAEVTLENVGDAKLMYLGGAYSIVGYRAPFRSGEEQKSWPSQIPKELASQKWSAQFQKKEDLSLIEGGYDLFPSGDWIAPGTKVTTNWITYVKKDSYDGLIFNVAVATARADRMELRFPADPDHAEIPGEAKNAGVYSEWGIRETSMVNRVARGSRYVTVNYLVNSVKGEISPVQIEAFVDSEETRSQAYSEYNDRLNASYGVNEFTAEVYGDNWKK